MKIAFTGTRNLDSEAIEPIWEWLFEIPYKSHEWHVGDANGIDELVRNFAQYLDIKLVVHEVIYFEKWGFAERSQRLINSLNKGDLLIAFPNKECPKICTPKNFFSGHGEVYQKEGNSDPAISPSRAVWRQVSEAAASRLAYG